jgi:dihydrofolate reductase
MGKLVLKMSVSVDGFVCGPDGEIDWMFSSLDGEATAWIVDTLRRAGIHLMGSRTYHDMAAYWPTSTEPLAAPMNEIPKAVYTRSGALAAPAAGLTTRALADATAAAGGSGAATAHAGGWDAPEVLGGDLAEAVGRLRRRPGGDVVAHGGARFAQGLVELGLVDEYRLVVHPVALGAGRPLFSSLPGPRHLALVGATPFAGGAVAHVYRPA